MRYRMNPDPEKELALLVAEYWDNPPFLRRKDLKRINQLRQQLGMPRVTEELVEIVSEEADPEPVIHQQPKVAVDPHAMARQAFAQYQEKLDMMRPHLEYSNRMIRALAGRHMTPVKPLATGGTGGGPILCDFCEGQIPLEGGKYHGKGAGDAWELAAAEGYLPSDWQSFILNHVTFLQEVNGTFRAYHNYENSGCGGKAHKRDKQRRDDYRENGPKPPRGFRKAIHEFLQDELSMFGMSAERERIYQDIMRQLYQYDPGIGINRPD